MTRLLTIVVAALAGFGCTVTETGNPSFAAQMSLTATTSDEGRVSLEPGIGVVTVDQAWVAVGDIRFVHADMCDVPGEIEVDVPGPRIGDLAAGPDVVMLELEDDDYCRVRVPLERAELPLPAGAPPELEDHTIVLSGSRSDGTPFLVASRDTREADVRSRGVPFRLDEGQRAVLLSFDVALWLEGVDLDAGVVGADGIVRVDEDDNDELLRAFEANVERALRLFRDTDEDGELDTSELAELLAEG